ncbi:endonuclease domain of the non-LTR retrotransposon LINE-1 [Elysia marginata]|uniref:Endonuclease domain of the non-LTR retrotransposon LINE-1 n=1 Tax=Elysia marginata TaxID=1093978 RepID=A0AAV4H6P9_9GAST|nr:endonuclease domain of the non-LTR retrotransposon LINE-1 [Elysia marginata]
MGNVRSLHNKTDELYSLCRFYRYASNITLTETWLNENIPSSVCDLDNFTLIRHDRQGIQGKDRGGGVCTFINNTWCHPNNINVVRKISDTNIEILCVNARPHYLPREFTNVCIMTVNIPPDGNKTEACTMMRDTIEDMKQKSPDQVLIISGDLNHCNDFSFPGLYQFVHSPTREKKTLDLYFYNVLSSYKCLPKAPLGSSDHSMLLMLPPVVRKIAPIK